MHSILKQLCLMSHFEKERKKKKILTEKAITDRANGGSLLKFTSCSTEKTKVHHDKDEHHQNPVICTICMCCPSNCLVHKLFKLHIKVTHCKLVS